MSQPTAKVALAALTSLVGEWDLDLVLPDGNAHTAIARASFEWHLGGAFLLVRSVASGSDGPPSSTALIGCDAANGTYTQLYSDERGVCRTYRMVIDEHRWELHRDGDPFPQRFTATFHDDGATIRGRWEKDENGHGFATDFDLTYRRRS